MHKAKVFGLFVNVIFLFLIFCITLRFNSSSDSSFSNSFRTPKSPINYYQNFDDDLGCKELQKYHDKEAKCAYVKSHKGCQSKGYISYLQLFYCAFSPSLGYTLLGMWLLVLFYLLGDTASRYFCSSLESLSRTLKLSPTVAGVTLLPLGNGAPDVFGGIISFMGDGTAMDIGLNSILGGAFFVSSVVVGIISISVSNRGRIISSSSFTGNIFFLLFCLSCLVAIIIFGRINLWGAISFLSLYFIYVALFLASETYARRERIAEATARSPFLPVTIAKSSPEEESAGAEVPMLGFSVDNQIELQVTNQRGRTRSNLQFSASCFFNRLLCILETPLDLPRKLTIPIISEDKWSRPTAIVSTALAPVLLAAIWNLHHLKSEPLAYAIAALVGFATAILLFCISNRFNPPGKYQFPWHAESFLMSITWTYILAQELISLLVSFGIILGISHSVMGLTVLAWGNSLGDFVSDFTVAQNGGSGGAQIAVSGCYAGPIFNIIFGLGLSLVLSSWAVYPSSFVIVSDPSVFETFGFFMIGLLWAFLVLKKRNMRLDKLLGSGLVAIYSCFLSLKLARSFGLVKLYRH